MRAIASPEAMNRARAQIIVGPLVDLPHTDLAVIGAGAAGLMAAIQARRADPGLTVRVFDGARTLGAKILVAGGGRCNVTHDEVDERAYAGSTPPAIRKVLRQFSVEETIRFFSHEGVELKREDSGKLFPVTDDARTVLTALLRAADRAGVTIHHPWRVSAIERGESGFALSFSGEVPRAPIVAPRAVLATGGMSLPKTGSDGFGHELARRLGHSITPHVFPALVPLELPAGHFLRELSGITFVARLELRSGAGKRLTSFTNSTLCTHFGLSGPSILDISRYWRAALFEDRATTLILCAAPDLAPESLDARLLAAGRTQPLSVLKAHMPERLARALIEDAQVDIALSAARLSREQRRAIVQRATALVLPVTSDRGFRYAEVTAGGVPLGEIDLSTMESRRTAGLYLCGEVCDVDGRIGGFNFQWAWSSGTVAGRGAATRARSD